MVTIASLSPATTAVVIQRDAQRVAAEARRHEPRSTSRVSDAAYCFSPYGSAQV